MSASLEFLAAPKASRPMGIGGGGSGHRVDLDAVVAKCDSLRFTVRSTLLPALLSASALRFVLELFSDCLEAPLARVILFHRC